MGCKAFFLGGCALAVFGMGVSMPALAQSAKDEDQVQAEDVFNEGDIIVTARRRVETAQETPVALTVLNEALLDRYAVKNISSIVSLTPGLVTSEASGAMGGTISLRGVGSGDSMAFIDQAVSANVDGVPISTAQILRAAQMDLQQIEVLRGPQALFFGKNSPGGIISLTTADPGDRLEMMVRGGYEFKANERYVDAMISTPISETVGLRVAGHFSKMDGYIKVFTPNLPNIIPSDLKAFPKQDELFFRGTLKWVPSDRVSVKLKATIADTDILGGSSYFSDITYCPYGTPQRPLENPGNCENDGVIWTSQFTPAAMAQNPYLMNPNGNRNNNQTLLSGTIDYELSDALKLTSVTGYYKVTEKMTSNGGYGPTTNNAFFVGFRNSQLSQELRLASDFDGPMNFLAGGFYEQRKLYTLTAISVPDISFRLPTESTHQKQKTYSLFGQVMFDINDQLQLTAGGRYTHETKDLLDYTVTLANGTTTDATTLPAYPGTKLKFNNFSPEITLTYKPSDDMMLFASYKKGYKSGGFDAGYTNGSILATPQRGQTFKPESVSGFEAGLKSQFADRQVTMNLTGYWYDYSGLQVSVFDTIARAFRLQNAAKARVRGLELETRFRPDSVPGLNLHATVAYNDAKYRSFLSECYAGQTVAMGCDTSFVAAASQDPAATPGASTVNGVRGYYVNQDLSGRQMRKAPKLSAAVGAYYETPVSDGLMVSLSSDVAYSGAYVYGSNFQPWARQSAFAKVDATLRLFSEDKKWELALIGRNLTNKRNLVNGIDRTGTGGVRNGNGTAVSAAAKGNNLASCTGVGQNLCSSLADLIGTPTVPRTVALQFTWRY